ncbi:hypothetical protein [Accumulibacter sp.]|uniref:phage tail assembly protein T n=1 Tax=Accumulibacter sp. TaxID=2053492 RepID=UPI0025D41DEC|nr:hypothetical protein [Accumulibacter sp.]MCM8596654.1 hypothetical protein [Accumulibacter sp.]MCM8625964.1 hypothetical protein [Accumulibacter sp.]MDS4050802.1 hypothetical protein [Accumulibacter sp.]
MLFRLALAMGRTIAELRAVLSYAEFQEWCGYYAIEPWGETRADLRAGIVASTVHNVYAGWVGSDHRATPADYMPYLERSEPPPTDERALTDDELADWADATLFGMAPGI